MNKNILLLAAAGLAVYFFMPKGEADTSRTVDATIPYSDITPKGSGSGDTYNTYYNLGGVSFPKINIPPATDAPKDAGGNIAPALGTSSGNTGLRYGDTVGGVFSGVTYNNPYTDYGAINAQSYLTMSKQQLFDMPTTKTRQVSGDFGYAVSKDFPQSVLPAKKEPKPVKFSQPLLMKPLMPIKRM